MSEQENRDKKRMPLLTGATLFFALVVYFNIRSPEPTTMIDWAVMGLGALFFLFALARRFRKAV